MISNLFVRVTMLPLPRPEDLTLKSRFVSSMFRPVRSVEETDDTGNMAETTMGVVGDSVTIRGTLRLLARFM